MASKQAQSVVREVLTVVGVLGSDADIKVALHNVDAELAEVREVVNECINRLVRLGAEDDKKTLGPDPTLQRARSLYKSWRLNNVN